MWRRKLEQIVLPISERVTPARPAFSQPAPRGFAIAGQTSRPGPFLSFAGQAELFRKKEFFSCLRVEGRIQWPEVVVL